MLPVRALLRLSALGLLKGHRVIRQVAHSAIPVQKRDAALAIRGISLAPQLQGMQSSARHVTGVKIIGIGKLMTLVFTA
jgi:hypothetical protein